jgi:hypothetical protein
MATDYYELRVQGLHQTEYNECVMHFEGTNLTAADYLDNAKDLCESFDAALVGLWMALFPTSYELLRLTARKASPGGGAAYTVPYPIGTNVGTVAGGAASQQLCPVVRLIPPMGIKTAGKIFLPCIAESQIAANVVNSTWLANVAALMSPMVTGFNNSSITWKSAIYSRKNGTFALTVAYDTSPIVGFQRKRQRSPL